MKLVRQPPGSKVCGQACVATLAGVSLGKAIMQVGKAGKTKTIDLKRGLDANNIKHGSRRERGMPDKSVTALLFWTGEHGCHWTVWHKGKYYDPVAGVYRKTPRHLSDARVTSFLRVEL